MSKACVFFLTIIFGLVNDALASRDLKTTAQYPLGSCEEQLVRDVAALHQRYSAAMSALDAEFSERRRLLQEQLRTDLSALLESLDTKISKNGSVFTRVKDHVELGEAWQDSENTIWGAVVKSPAGGFQEMSYEDAVKYCSAIGAELPSIADFFRLRDYLGAKNENGQGYRAAIFSDLPGTSTWIQNAFNQEVYVFDGSTGSMELASTPSNHVRCVRRVIK